MRRILCKECGAIKPTPYEDAALGFFPRRTYGKVINEMMCDLCGKILPRDSDVVAESIPKDMRDWEGEYFYKL